MSDAVNVERRSVLSFIASFPALASIRRFSQNKCDERLAMQVMRLVNTMERWHNAEFGEYVDGRELTRSPVFARIKTDKRLERNGLGKSLLARVALDQDEVIEGWDLQVRVLHEPVGHGKSGYVAAVASKGRRQARAFATDETGLIHEGALRSDRLPKHLPVSIGELAWDDVAPVGQSDRYSKFPAMLAEFLLVQTASCEEPPSCQNGCQYCAGLCCYAYPICCCYGGGFGHCNDHYLPGCCNVGCSGCYWCCCGT